MSPSRRPGWGATWALWLLLLGACASTPPSLPSDDAPPPQPLAVAAPPPPASAPSLPPAEAHSAVAAPAPPASAAAATVTAEPEPEPEPVAGAATIDPLRPDMRVDPDDAQARADLWERVRRGFAMPDLDTKQVRAQERWYASRPDYVQRMTERGSRYLFHIVEEVEKRGMPTELVLLPFIESAFNPQALSSARAAGIWQFIPSTGRHFDLTQNVFRDDRRDVLASTRAALDYLGQLHAMFGDWHLALAAYNWGEGSVRRAIERNRRARRPTDYASLRMPAETRQYVPKLQAVKNLVAQPQAFGVELPALANHPYFLSVSIDRDIDVEVAARLANLGIDEFRALNPQLNKPVILAAGTPQLLLPYDNANDFVRNLPLHPGPTASWTAWVAPKTLHPAEAAKHVGMNEQTLREVNQIPPRMLVRAGSTLVVPRDEQRQADVSGQVADNATMTLAPDRPGARRVVLKVGRKGDTVRAVARRHHVKASDVALWNRTHVRARLRAGQQVVLYLVRKAPVAKSRGVTRKATATKSRGVAKAKVVARKTVRARAARPVATASTRARVTGN